MGACRQLRSDRGIDDRNFVEGRASDGLMPSHPQSRRLRFKG